MKVEIKKLDKLKRVIRVEVEGSILKKDKNQLYKELGKKLKVPGFRLGVAPPDILERYHSKFLKEEFLKWALPVYYGRAVEENHLSPASLPHIFDIELTDKKLTFCAQFEVKPQIQLEANVYKGIKIKDKPVKVEEGEWEKMLNSLKDEITKITNQEPSDTKIANWAGYSTLTALKEAAVAEIKNVKLRQRRQDIEAQVVNFLLKTIKVEAPSKLVQDNLDKLVNQEVYNLRLRGVPQEDIDKYRVDLEQKLKPIAEDQVKLYHILEAIAKKENLKVDPEGLYQAVIGYILSLAEYVESS
jgi:FKBP-type peptidyl-prolyl cis-trans isomerase (trigger factor)